MKKLVSIKTGEFVKNAMVGRKFGILYKKILCFRVNFIVILCFILVSCEDSGEPADSSARMMYRIIGVSVAVGLVPVIRNYFRDLKNKNDEQGYIKDQEYSKKLDEIVKKRKRKIK
jgi:hypothetical protein